MGDRRRHVDIAQLCLSELVTNVVMHARTSSELTLHLEDDVLTVVVRDLGGSSRSGDPGATIPRATRRTRCGSPGAA